MDSGAIGANIVESIITMLGGTVSKTTVRNQSKLQKCLELPVSQRRYCFMQRNELESVAKARNIETKGLSVAQIKEQLVVYDEQQANDNGSEPIVNKEESQTDPALVKLLQQAFLRPVKKDAFDARSKGHELEEPYLQGLWELVEHNPTLLPFDLEAVYRNGMCSMRAQKSTKDTSDAVGMYRESDFSDAESSSSDCSVGDKGKLGVVPIECKARVSLNTVSRAIQNLKKKLGLEQFSNYAVPFVDVDEMAMNDYVPDDHENLQLLHHVYTYGAKHGLMAIGDNESLMYCVLVSFSEELKEAYGEILDFMYGDLLNPFWDRVQTSPRIQSRKLSNQSH